MLHTLHSFLLLDVYLCTETSIDTTIVSLPIFVFSKKLKKSSGVLYIGCCNCAIVWSSVSTKYDILAVGSSQPAMIGLPTGVGLCIFVRWVWSL